jgi:hypothetical protein
LTSSSAPKLAHASNTSTKVTEVGRTHSCCICQNSSCALFSCLHFVCPSIIWHSKWPHLEMASCWTFSKHPQGSRILHTCQPNYSPQTR